MNKKSLILLVWLLALLPMSAPFDSARAQEEDVIEFEDDESMFNEDEVEEEMAKEDKVEAETPAATDAVTDAATDDATNEVAPAEETAESAAPTVAPTVAEPEEGAQDLAAPVEEAEELEEPTTPESLLAEPTEEPQNLEEPQNIEEPSAPESTTLSADVTSGDATSAEPDLELEAQLYDIYMRHLSQSTSEEEWSRVVGDRVDQTYIIQKGDTLWDISRTLFGDGNYWPKIWSLNSSITNPHIIRPNNRVRFILGDETGAPRMAITDAEGEEESESPSQTLSTYEGEDGPEIPPPTKRYNPVVKKLPPSFPAYQDPSSLSSGYDDAGIEYGRRKIADLKDQIFLSAYVSESSPKALGVVSEVEMGFNLASSLQYVYVRMNKGEGDVGATYLSVLDRGQVKADRRIVKDTFLGIGIEVLGEVQLLEKVSSEKNKEEDGDVYRALVTRTVSPVSVGSALIPGQIEKVDLSEEGERSQIVAQIVGGQFTNDRQLYGPQSFAYLNKGENHGLRAGQILPIRLNRKARDPQSQVLANVRAIGWLKIVKTSPRFSTAVILRAWEGVMTGDYTGAGEMNMAQSVQEQIPNSEAPSQEASLLDELGEEAEEAPGEEELSE